MKDLRDLKKFDESKCMQAKGGVSGLVVELARVKKLAGRSKLAQVCFLALPQSRWAPR